MSAHTDRDEGEPQLPRITWPTLPDMPLLIDEPIFRIGPRCLYSHSPTTILKFGIDEGEGDITALARSIIGPIVPHVLGVVSISDPKEKREGLLLSRQPGTSLDALWPSLSPTQRATVKAKLCELLLRMRRHRFSYYGRPGEQPYITTTDSGVEQHTFCTTRIEWDDSRIRALRKAAPGLGIDEARRLFLEQVQHENVCDYRPVLTHEDLAPRNLLVDPETLEVTGFLDWERSNIAPAYYEYVMARLSTGYEPEWRKELLDVLRNVLRVECEMDQGTSVGHEVERKYETALEAWKSLVDVERAAQNYGDDCSWTYETDSQ
ncbi:hypothetical protein DAEQUDRAFT_731794 [Daedalea quercina L-15889]|uniref:Aminoglycoside phosphotransferase domain-containing protein n=1 Tax=Daedalea quercina L-15889 TaxID=1314783 RepID=A0A165LZY1_9APHY|nr:hypothetical protein DAEQUDRAFT_731794 [Daedalea quercina L-15889]